MIQFFDKVIDNIKFTFTSLIDLKKDLGFRFHISNAEKLMPMLITLQIV